MTRPTRPVARRVVHWELGVRTGRFQPEGIALIAALAADAPKALAASFCRGKHGRDVGMLTS